jgi:hypothetical protein
MDPSFANEIIEQQACLDLCKNRENASTLMAENKIRMSTLAFVVGCRWKMVIWLCGGAKSIHMGWTDEMKGSVFLCGHGWN